MKDDQLNRIKRRVILCNKDKFSLQDQQELGKLGETDGHVWNVIESCVIYIDELRKELRYLRAYGNKDCTAMAEDAMMKGILDET